MRQYSQMPEEFGRQIEESGAFSADEGGRETDPFGEP